MTRKDAIKILMLSPFYFRLDIEARNVLIKEFCLLCLDQPENLTCQRHYLHEQPSQ